MIDGRTVVAGDVGRGAAEKWQFHTEIILCLISAWFPSSYSHLACGEAIGGFDVPWNNRGRRHAAESNGGKKRKEANISPAYGSPVWPRLYQPQLSKWIPPPSPHDFGLSADVSKVCWFFDIFQLQLLVTVTWSRHLKKKESKWM